jgi:hypothetical protein
MYASFGRPCAKATCTGKMEEDMNAISKITIGDSLVFPIFDTPYIFYDVHKTKIYLLNFSLKLEKQQAV